MANLGWFLRFSPVARMKPFAKAGRAVEIKTGNRRIAYDGRDHELLPPRAHLCAGWAKKNSPFPLIEPASEKTPGAVDSVDYSITVNDLKAPLGMGTRFANDPALFQKTSIRDPREARHRSCWAEVGIDNILSPFFPRQ